MSTTRAKTRSKPAAHNGEIAARGRPPGSPNRNPETVDAERTRCPKCQSTDRQPYYRTTIAAYHGTDPAGQPCTHIVRRWTACAACGQHRIDRTYEFRKR